MTVPKKNGNSLFRAAGKLKRTKRAGWVKKAGIKDGESVADHSFRMAVIAAYLGELMNLDGNKLITMSLLHDLAESRIGDLTPDQKLSERQHRKMEDRAMKEIISTLPKKPRKRFMKYWNELIERKSDEAKLTWEIDKLEMGLQMKDYTAIGVTKEVLAEFDPSSSLSKKTKEIFADYS